jgi:potassium-transporting ATPase KdpC subunit
MKILRPALVLTLFFLVVTGLLFPLAVTGLAQVALPHQANGSVILVDGKPVGSELIGQNFTDEKFFHPRPSSGGYDANNSGGTNLGPRNPKLLTGADGFDGLKQLAAQYRATNQVAEDVVLPVDTVTRSASGLDPHISPANARLQASRVATANSLEISEVQAMILKATDQNFVGVFGEPGVNVLKLNLLVEAAR